MSAHEPKKAQYIITDLSISGVEVTYAEPHPEQTPIGPFGSREEAWDYAAWMQKTYGDGGGSVDVAPLHAPRSAPLIEEARDA